MILIARIGKIASIDPEAVLADRYLKRMKEVKIIEGDIRPSNKEKEGNFLIQATEGFKRILLDENGKLFSTEEFTQKMNLWRTQGKIAFLIGGADGHSEKTRQSAHETLSLSPLTFPHKLVCVILIEQIYRAMQITAGHPYHRV
jgi:23S rRNA (pseudouridine1915-N3)-methyltransferase